MLRLIGWCLPLQGGRSRASCSRSIEISWCQGTYMDGGNALKTWYIARRHGCKGGTVRGEAFPADIGARNVNKQQSVVSRQLYWEKQGTHSWFHVMIILLVRQKSERGGEGRGEKRGFPCSRPSRTRDFASAVKDACHFLQAGQPCMRHVMQCMILVL